MNGSRTELRRCVIDQVLVYCNRLAVFISDVDFRLTLGLSLSLNFNLSLALT